MRAVQSISPLSIVLLNLEDNVANDLASMLLALNHRVSHSSTDIDSADMVFCDRESMAKTMPSGVPLVAVSPEANESAWLEALDEGAADYLSVPYEPRQVHWILEAHFRRPAMAVAAGAVGH
jgi:DNA-binding response OmpR family regulator